MGPGHKARDDKRGNKPELVIVVESPVSEENKIVMFRDIEARLARFSEVGGWNQKI